MENKNYDPAVDAYIAKAENFARPILEHWRRLVHENCPKVEEAIKWGIPHFDYKGDHMCVMASHKAHSSFTFLKGDLMSDSRLKSAKDLKPIKRLLGKITQFSELIPDQEFIVMIKEAVQLNEMGVKIQREKPVEEKPKVLETPDFFLNALEGSSKAKDIFESRSNSFRKEYIIWISDAKTDQTRQKRIDEALEWIADGKGRFWKHQK